MNEDNAFHQWLLEEGRASEDLAELLNGFCLFLNKLGFQIRRSTMALGTLHPQTEALRYVWYDSSLDPGPFPAPSLFYREIHQLPGHTIDETHLSFGCRDNPVYRASPFYQVDQDGKALHLKINPIGEEQAYPLMEELAKLGCTDYFCRRFSKMENDDAMISLVTDSPSGFSGEQLTQLAEWLPYVGLIKDLHRAEVVNRTLLDVYLGHNPGEKVLSGSIKPGDVQQIDAAIWYSDLRGFSSISQTLSPEELVLWMNRYFEILIKRITHHKGEILKFVGDAVLAIFPIDENGSSVAADAAYQCALEVEEALAELNESLDSEEPEYRHGIALHLGKVMYGNVGALKRLDFTVIGNAVNLAARIEGLCKPLGQSLLCSQSFDEHTSTELKELGEHQVQGIEQPVRVYGRLS